MKIIIGIKRQSANNIVPSFQYILPLLLISLALIKTINGIASSTKDKIDFCVKDNMLANFLVNFIISKLKKIQTSYDIFFKRCCLDFERIAVCIGAIFPIPLHTPLKLIREYFYRTYQRIFMSDSRGVAGNDLIPPTPPKYLNYRGELPCFSALNSLILDVQNRGGNPLFKSGIFSLKEEVLRGGSISNDFSFPLVSEHTSHFFIVQINQGG